MHTSNADSEKKLLLFTVTSLFEVSKPGREMLRLLLQPCPDETNNIVFLIFLL